MTQRSGGEAESDSTSIEPHGGVSRRTVITATGALTVAGVLAACGGGGSASTTSATTSGATTAPPAPSPTNSGATTPAGVLAPTSDIPLGSGVVFADPQVVVTHPTKDEFRGFSSICPHQGCPVDAVEMNEIICPCHGSRFSAETGAVLQGPAVQGLAVAPVSVVDGFVVLD